MAIFTVNNLNDSGTGSLRQAIEGANALSGRDEIIFEDSLSGGTITLDSGQLEITDSLTVRGLGADRLTLRGSKEALPSENRIFLISDSLSDSEIDVELTGLTLTEGFVARPGTRPTGSGGAIVNSENLTIADSVLSNNSALTRGGAITNGGMLKVKNSAIVNNTAFGATGFSLFDGGGIFNSGTAIIENSTIADNSAKNIGGGIVNDIDASLEVINSTITGNTVTRNSSSPYLSIPDEAFVRAGAGIYNSTRPSRMGGSGTVTITSSIVANNLDEQDNYLADLGGGILEENPPSVFFNSNGNNLIGNGDNVEGFNNGVNEDIVGTAANPINPLLGTLQNNGGATPTIALFTESPAVDAGSNPNNLEFDQRGEGAFRVVGESADIGAFELQELDTLVGIFATTPVATEGESNGVFTISRGAQTTGELVIELLISDRGTVDIADYKLTGNNLSVSGAEITVTIPDGESNTDLVFEPVDDEIAEVPETFTLDLVSSQGYNIDGDNPSATITIPQNDFDGNTVVTNTNDEGTGSLRQAILNANLFEGTDTITFDPSLQEETIVLTSGELVITDSVNIEGLENRGITISGNNYSRVFNIDDGNDDSQIDVSISDVIVTEGRIEIEDGSFPEPADSGIFSRENLTIVHSAVTGNTGDGIIVEGSTLNIDSSDIENNSIAGVTNRSGTAEIINSNITDNRIGINSGSYTNGLDDSTLFLEQSTISGNDSSIKNEGIAVINDSAITNNGGGIRNSGNLELDRTIISENESFSNFRVFGDGGITNSGYGSVTIYNSIISNNSASNGGGIFNNGKLEIVSSLISENKSGEIAGFAFGDYGGGIDNRGMATIINSTISGNSANNGGGISQRANIGYGETSLTIINSTISGNSASQGSGIYNAVTYNEKTYSFDTTVTSTIIAGNDNDEDIAGSSFTSKGNNLIGNGDGTTGFTNGVNGDIVGTNANPIDPLLGTLQDNGGSTPTIALLDGSPAIDAGSNPLDLETDQRGEGFARVIGSQTDIGAFEADADTNPPDEGQLIIGTNKRDSLVGGAGDDTIDGFLARDTIAGGAGDDDLFGGRGKDLIFGDAGNDEIAGNQGGDTLEGGSGSDTLFGDEGRDVLVGGAGLDILIGGGAADSFVIASGEDTDGIIDFEQRRDKLLLSEGLSFSGLTLNQNNEDVDIVLTETNELLAVLIDTDVNNLGESNFVAG